MHVIPGDPVHVWQFESTEGYWCELNVDGVIEGQPALQIHQLFVVPTLRCLHHIVDVEHPRLSAVRHNHHTQVWQPGRADTRMFRLHPWNHSRRTRIESDISAVKPGALDHAQWSGVDLRADLSQHLTEILRFKLAWADNGFTLDLHMTSQFNWIYILKKHNTVIVIVGIVVMWWCK